MSSECMFVTDKFSLTTDAQIKLRERGRLSSYGLSVRTTRSDLKWRDDWRRVLVRVSSKQLNSVSYVLVLVARGPLAPLLGALLSYCTRVRVATMGKPRVRVHQSSAR
eukprot:scaffold164981_cov21-Prasinocladus_malaysianus.AAC.1